MNKKLKVWWIPQIPMEPFEVEVKNIEEAKLILNTLAKYDLFQLEHNVKANYCNEGGLLEFDPDDKFDSPKGSWTEWYNENSEDITYVMKKEQDEKNN